MEKIEFSLQVIAVMSVISSWALYQTQHYLKKLVGKITDSNFQKPLNCQRDKLPKVSQATEEALPRTNGRNE